MKKQNNFYLLQLILSSGNPLAAKNVKYMSLNNQPCLVRHIDLNPNKLFYYPFVVDLDRRNGSSNTVTDFSDNFCEHLI